MTDTEYLDRAEYVLTALEQACDRINDETDIDIDNQRVGGMVTLTFRDRSQMVVNLQPPLHEIWVAARSGGFHYQWGGDRWQDTKAGTELFADLTRHMSEHAGSPLQLEINS
jgi:CyaY protein